MNCLQCKKKSCRGADSCGAEEDIHDRVLQGYKSPYEQRIVQSAARLVDDGRAGRLSRLEEIAEFSGLMEYESLGIAYCFSMEEEAALVAEYLKNGGFSVSSVCCTVGGMEQRAINNESSIASVSCNPVFQAEQLNNEDVDLVITMGLCLGHDILLNRYLKVDRTNLVVKDRTADHNPLAAIRSMVK